MVRAVANPSKVYVGNLPSDLHKDDLKRALGKYGNLRKVWLAHNPPGFAFVDFYNAREARVCVRELDGRRLFGCTLRVELSTGTEPPRTYHRRESHRNGSTSPYDCGRDSVSPPQQYDHDNESTASSSHHEFDPSTRVSHQDNIHLQHTVKKMAENLLYLVSQCHHCQYDMERLYTTDSDRNGYDLERSYTERLALIAKGRGSPSSRRAMCNQVETVDDKRRTRIRARPIRSLVHKASQRATLHRSSR